MSRALFRSSRLLAFCLRYIVNSNLNYNDISLIVKRLRFPCTNRLERAAFPGTTQHTLTNVSYQASVYPLGLLHRFIHNLFLFIIYRSGKITFA